MLSSASKIEEAHNRITKQKMLTASDFPKALYTTTPLAMITPSKPEFMFQVAMEKLLDEQTSKMIKDTDKPPADGLKIGESFLASSNFPNDEVMRGTGTHVI